MKTSSEKLVHIYLVFLVFIWLMKGRKKTKSINTDCWYWNNYNDKSSHSDSSEISTAFNWDVALPTLNIDQGIVDAFFSQKLLMSALLYDLAILDHCNLVSILDGGEAVSYHDARTTVSSFIQSFLDNLHNEQTKKWTILAALVRYTSIAICKL